MIKVLVLVAVQDVPGQDVENKQIIDSDVRTAFRLIRVVQDVCDIDRIVTGRKSKSTSECGGSCCRYLADHDRPSVVRRHRQALCQDCKGSMAGSSRLQIVYGAADDERQIAG